MFIVPPLTGHINPTVAVGEALLERGHELWWVGHKSALERSLPAPLHPRAHIWELGEGLGAEELGRLHAGRDKRGVAAFQFLWDGVLLPLAEASLSAILEAIEELQPELCVVDQQTLAGALACRLSGVPWLSSCTTSAGIVDALAELPQAAAWLQERLSERLRRMGLSSLAERGLNELTLSRRGVIIFSSEQLSRSAHPAAQFPDHYRFVGPALKAKRAPLDFPWERLDSKKAKVFMSLGTVNAERGARVYRAALEAFSDGAYQLCLVAPAALLPSERPDWLITQERVPQLELLPKMDLVITHAGHNTTCESLANGLPLLLLPIKDDQPIIAEQVKRAGAGLRLPFARVKSAQLREAVDRLLNEPQFREAASRLSADFRAMGDGGAGGATCIERALTELAEGSSSRD